MSASTMSSPALDNFNKLSEFLGNITLENLRNYTAKQFPNVAYVMVVSSKSKIWRDFCRLHFKGYGKNPHSIATGSHTISAVVLENLSSLLMLIPDGFEQSKLDNVPTNEFDQFPILLVTDKSEVIWSAFSGKELSL
jgi:hypothetical protein